MKLRMGIGLALAALVVLLLLSNCSTGGDEETPVTVDSPTPVAIVSPTPAATPFPTQTTSPTPSPPPAATPTPTSTATPTPTPEPTPTATTTSITTPTSTPPTTPTSTPAATPIPPPTPAETLIAEPTPASTSTPPATPTSTPSATEPEQAVEEYLEGLEPGDGVEDVCVEHTWFSTGGGPSWRWYWMLEGYIQWSQDGNNILFSSPPWGWPGLYSVDPNGVMLHEVVEKREDRAGFEWGNHPVDYRIPQIIHVPDRVSAWGDGQSSMKYFDISPNGSHLVFSTCAFTEVATHEVDSLGWGKYRYNVVSADGVPTPDRPDENGRVWVYNYEIVLSDIDGTNRKRLTENIHFNNFPAWSPDGSKIAFISDSNPTYDIGGWVSGEIITIYTVETGQSEEIVLTRGVLLYPHRLAWSPDGERIAFVAEVWPRPLRTSELNVYTVRVDGTDLRKITDAASGPAWSPDGQRIAVAVPVGEDDPDLYTFAADGSDPVLVTEFLPDPWDFPADPWIGDLSWSPDGSQILLKSRGYRVILDGSPLYAKGVAIPMYGLLNGIYTLLSEQIMDMTWSPDGSQIAISLMGWGERGLEGPVYIANRDGKNLRPLVKSLDFRDPDRSYEAWLAGLEVWGWETGE